MHEPEPTQQGALPMHLSLAMMPWLASLHALQLSSSALPGLKLPPAPAAPGELERLWRELLQNPKAAQALEKEARARAATFLSGLLRYRAARYVRELAEPPCIWQAGSARLLDYGGEPDAPVLFLVPSLINRYYILDLSARLSFARYMRSRGMRVFVLDWGDPGRAEEGFNCAMYITERLAPALRRIRRESLGPVVLGGYCMGGVLALGLASLCPEEIDALALFATPWDFSAPDFPHLPDPATSLPWLESYIEAAPLLPAETIHTLFHISNPYAFQGKLREFSRMEEGTARYEDFLAVEHWVQDGAAMTRGVARDSLVDWAHRNTTQRGEWLVAGRAVEPKRLRMPAFVAAPHDDRIVPSACALPLVDELKNATLVRPPSGHVGMLVGSRRRSMLWEPFAAWVKGQFA